MLQNKSLEDFNCVGDEQLFTDLTPEEASAVKGGASLQVRYLFANNPPENDPIIMVGRNTVWSRNNVNTTTRIFRSFTFDGETTLSIWDQDSGGRNNDDLIAFVNLTQTRRGIRFLEGGGYRLSYRVT